MCPVHCTILNYPFYVAQDRYVLKVATLINLSCVPFRKNNIGEVMLPMVPTLSNCTKCWKSKQNLNILFRSERNDGVKKNADVSEPEFLLGYCRMI